MTKTTKTTKTKTTKPKDDSLENESKFLDAVLSQNKNVSEIGGIKLRPPTLATLAILTKCRNALTTGQVVSEEDVMMHVLVFMYVHSAPMDEVHGASIIQQGSGMNLALERKALEMGEKMPFKNPKEFVKLYEDLLAWLSEHMDLRVEPIPDESNKGKPPNPNE